MQQLLYKYLVLNNRLNIPSLGSFSVGYAPAQYNPQDGSLLPKQPILQFKDGPPATADTGLLPFLAVELNISPAVAANELLNFSLQVMAELVEHKRAHLKGIGFLTKDGFGQLHFTQETATKPIQPAVQAQTAQAYPAAARPIPTAPAQSAAPLNVPSPLSTPAASGYPAAAPMASSTGSTPTTKKTLPEGKLDPTLDYAGIHSYQESPDMQKVRQQLAQRREQVNSEFGDLREARERMKRVPLPGKEGEWPASQQPYSTPPSNPTPISNAGMPTSIPSATPGTRRANPFLSGNTAKGFGRTEYPPITDAIKSASNSLADLPVEIPRRTTNPRAPIVPPDNRNRWAPSMPQAFPPKTDSSGNDTVGSDPLTVRMPKRTWQTPERPVTNRSDSSAFQSTPLPTIGMRGRTGGSRILGETPAYPTPAAEQESTRKWPWQQAADPTPSGFQLPKRFQEETTAEEELEERPGFFARLKASVSGIFSRKQEVSTIIEEEMDEEQEGSKIGGLITKAGSKLVEMKNSELDTSGEPKKDYWWVYSIFLAFVATVAIIVHLF